MKKQTQINMVLMAMMMSASSFAEEVLKEPNTHADLTHTRVSVDIQRGKDKNYIYRYTIKSPAKNKGDISTFFVDLACDKKFVSVVLPRSTGKKGYIDVNKFPELTALKKGAHTPAAVSAVSGSVESYGVTIDNHAFWEIDTHPKETMMGLQIVSPAEPGMRMYTLELFMDTEDWTDLEQSEFTNSSIQELSVSGMIPGPGCPGVTPLADIGQHPGSVVDLNDIQEQENIRTHCREHRDKEEKAFEPLITYIGAESVRPFILRMEKTIMLSISGCADFSSITGKLNDEDISSLLSFKETGLHPLTLPFVEGENKIEIEVSPMGNVTDDVLSSLRQVHKLTVNYEPDIPILIEFGGQSTFDIRPGMTDEELRKFMEGRRQDIMKLLPESGELVGPSFKK